MKEIRDISGKIIEKKEKQKLIEDHAKMLYSSKVCLTHLEARRVAINKFCDEEEINEMKRDLINLFDITVDDLKEYF